MRRSLCWRGYKTRRSSAELLPADVALQRFKSKFLCRDAKWLQLGFVCTNKIVVCLKKKDKRNLSETLRPWDKGDARSPKKKNFGPSSLSLV